MSLNKRESAWRTFESAFRSLLYVGVDAEEIEIRNDNIRTSWPEVSRYFNTRYRTEFEIYALLPTSMADRTPASQSKLLCSPVRTERGIKFELGESNLRQQLIHDPIHVEVPILHDVVVELLSDERLPRIGSTTTLR